MLVDGEERERERGYGERERDGKNQRRFLDNVAASEIFINRE